MTEVSCVDCSHFNLRDAGQMARQGCGNCKHDAAYSYYSASKRRDCGKFNPADIRVIDKRKAWLNRGGEMKMRRRRSRKAALALSRRQEMTIASRPLVSRLVALFGAGGVSRVLDDARAAIERGFSVIKREWLCR